MVLASSFGDIFFNNCFNNGLLPVILDESIIDELFERAVRTEGLELTVDLEHCEISSSDRAWRFVVEPGRRRNLLDGLDEIGRTLTYSGSIRNYEATRSELEPWLY